VFIQSQYKSCYAASLEIHPKINKGQKRAFCCIVLFNHIRQMALAVDADANNLVSAGEPARWAGARWTLPRI